MLWLYLLAVYSLVILVPTTVHAQTTLIHDTFDDTLDSWEFMTVYDKDANELHCGYANVDDPPYEMGHSKDHEGSLRIFYNNGCWLGNVGAAKSFEIPEDAGDDLKVTFDYRSIAYSQYSNMYISILDNQDNELYRESLHQDSVHFEWDDTLWQNAAFVIPTLDTQECPCKIFIFTIDAWAGLDHKGIFFDNVLVQIGDFKDITPIDVPSEIDGIVLISDTFDDSLDFLGTYKEFKDWTQ